MLAVCFEEKLCPGPSRPADAGCIMTDSCLQHAAHELHEFWGSTHHFSECKHNMNPCIAQKYQSPADQQRLHQQGCLLRWVN